MAVFHSGISLAFVLSFLIINPGFCFDYSPKNVPWNLVCPEEKCISVDLSIQGKTTYSGSTDKRCLHNIVYCIKRVDPLSIPGLRHLWYRYHFTLTPTSDKGVTLIMGNSTEVVMREMKQTGTGWTQSKRVVGTAFGSSPYEAQCTSVRLMPDKTCNVDGHKFTLVFDRRLQLFFPVALMVGLFLFLFSPYFTNNLHFYYSSGIALGIVASLLILLYIFSRFVPKGNLFGLGVLLGGYSFTGFFLHWIYTQGLSFVQDNLFFVICYIVVSGMVSFAILYRMGPAHERTITLVKWFLQLAGLFLVFLSMQFIPFGVGLVTFVLIWNNMPERVISFVSTIFLWVFFCFKPLRKLFRKPVKKKLLTTEQYEQQGAIETAKAMNALRSHCRKIDNIWGNLNTFIGEKQLKNFLVGGDHVSKHQTTWHKEEYGSDNDSSTSDEDGDHTPLNISNYSSDIPSPNPSPPSAPLYTPVPRRYPIVDQRGFHTAYN